MRDNTLRRQQQAILKQQAKRARQKQQMEQENPMKISTILRILSMLFFANIFGGK